jgi:hypothetical protein
MRHGEGHSIEFVSNRLPALGCNDKLDFVAEDSGLCLNQ